MIRIIYGKKEDNKDDGFDDYKSGSRGENATVVALAMDLGI